MRHFLLFLLFLGLVVPLVAQTNPVAQLKVSQQLPSELLKGRSVVMVAPAQSSSAKKESWEALAKVVHAQLRTVGVDAVAYYELGNVLSGPDAIEGFVKNFQQREIQNILFIEKKGDAITLTVAPLGKKGLVDAGAPAWQTTAATAQQAVGALSQSANSANLHLLNLLIPEDPELFYTTDLSIKKRLFSYPLDLKFDKMAVPRYRFMSNRSSADSLAALQSIMSLYPYQWAPTEPGTAEDVLRMKQGYQYVLLYLHTGQDNIRRFLSYPPNKEAPLELQSGEDTGEPLYKFYIRHIATGDVYAGSSWDAAADWQVALRNFVQGLRKDQAANIK